MEQDKKSQYILITIILVLLVLVLTVGIVIAIKYKNNELKMKTYYFNQVYYGEYKIDAIDEKYYIGYIDDQQINVIINNAGKEVFSNGNDIYYDGIYKTKEDNYIIYSNRNNEFIIYLFNGEKLEKLKEFNDVTNVKPILYSNGNIEYIVGFTTNDNDNLYLYMLNDLETIVINNTTLVGDEYKKGIFYTYNTNALVVSNNNNMGVIDYNGNLVIDYKYKDILNTYDGTIIVKNQKDKYGILNFSGEYLIKANYKVIDLIDNYYLVVDSKNNLAVYDKNYTNLTGFNMKYNTTVEFDARNDVKSINLWRVGNNLVVVNNYLQDINNIDYSKGVAYFIKNNKISKTIKEVGFANDGVVYSYNKNYIVNIYDSNLEEKYKIELKDAKKILNILKETESVIKIQYVNNSDEVIEEFFNNGELVDFNYGNVIGKKDEVYIIQSEDYVSIYNDKMEKIDSLTGNYFKYNNGYLVVDNGIYKVEKRN